MAKTRIEDKELNPGLTNKEQSAMRRGEKILAKSTGNKGNTRTISPSTPRVPVKITNRQPRIGGSGIAGAFGIKNK